MKYTGPGEPASHTLAAVEPASASAAPQILCDRMRQQEEVRNMEDDWTGITDPKLRRKLQNRLNQRAKRRRQNGKPQKKAFPDEQWDDLTELPTKTEDTSSNKTLSPSPATIISRFQQKSPLMPPVGLPRLSSLKPKEALNLLRAYEAWFRTRPTLSCPSSDLLLSLVQYNVFRALILNNFTLGLTMEWLDEDAISPFSGSYASRPDDLYPGSLRPTALQKTVEHHPWLDLFPHPQMRDNMIRNLNMYDEDKLCEAIVGWCQGKLGQCGVVVWKDPWDASGWEINESFAKDWPWVVAGCRELLQSTNFWRAQRGEKPLRFEEVT